MISSRLIKELYPLALKLRDGESLYVFAGDSLTDILRSRWGDSLTEILRWRYGDSMKDFLRDIYSDCFLPIVDCLNIIDAFSDFFKGDSYVSPMTSLICVLSINYEKT
jgi:hypothetical protein